MSRAPPGVYVLRPAVARVTDDLPRKAQARFVQWVSAVRASARTIMQWRDGMDQREDREVVDRVAETVRHALRLVGPAERGVERAPKAPLTDRPAA